jgi:uncharacterized cupin superfamily protein
VTYPAEAYRFIDQQICVLDGHLRFIEGADVHELDAGDCFQLGAPRDCSFFNESDQSCRYLVVLDKLTTPRHAAPRRRAPRRR